MVRWWWGVGGVVLGGGGVLVGWLPRRCAQYPAPQPRIHAGGSTAEKAFAASVFQCDHYPSPEMLRSEQQFSATLSQVQQCVDCLPQPTRFFGFSPLIGCIAWIVINVCIFLGP